ncbi:MULTISPECIES: universal stress protein [Weeksellaceae]|uniref:universal stress protein n=1 Tax=Weeksellaceae TaxID=2762318 RepID=UPI00162353BA|nr:MULTISPECIES: universal stress protein [Weeksellaceae]MCT3639637.1 universal stress protein [Elizabethkingia anophelis]MDE5470521.1 universal stress protein [Elizabethkingia meningoseptica]
MDNIEKILIVADDSPISVKAVHYGYALARQLRAKVALLSVENTLENPPDTLVPYEVPYAESRFEHLENFLSAMERDYADGIETEKFVEEGNIKETVLRVADKWKAQVIVAGTHARKGLGRLILGSTSEDILHGSKIPMFIVPMDKD